ncbi:MAG: PspA/IM30 family protein [Fusobacterium sp.]
MGIIKTIKALFDNKVDESNQKMIEDNPEAILNQAIKDEKAQYKQNEIKLSEMHSHHIEHKNQTSILRNNLIKIQQNISLAQRQGDVEAVKEGTSLYKQREMELAERIEIEKEIESAINEITEFMKTQRYEIEKLESEKVSLLARLSSANVKEEVMNLTSSMNFKENSSSFASAREAINKKINKVKGREIVNNSTQSSSKYFKGL